MDRICQDIALDSSLPWTEKLTTVYPQTIAADVNDDLARELELYVLLTCL
jgi:rRNA-processing protein EBP2